MKIRTDVSANYRAIFLNGKTIRQRIDSSQPIKSPKFAEIEDVAINNKCFAHCPYCYTSAVNTGINFPNIVEKSLYVWGSRNENDRPFQIAIGGAGESTLHPDWTEFVKMVRSLGIVPNYTTNGMHLTKDILKITEKYCGGVAISYHPHIEKAFHSGIYMLSSLDTILNAHFIIGDDPSLHNLKRLFEQYNDRIQYFVLLPYKAIGRAKSIETNTTWKSLFEWICTLTPRNQEKFAYGANFYDYIKDNNIGLPIDIYEPELYSGYRIFDDSFMRLRHSSYNLNFK